jgi:V/A-type H+/Na+-transporting ATPase subunit I
MYPEQMDRVVIVAPSDHLKQTIEILYKHKILHIIEHHKDRIDIGTPLLGSSQLADLLVKVRSMIHSLAIERETVEPVELSGDVKQRVNTINEHVMSALVKQKQLDDKLVAFKTEKERYNNLRWLHLDPAKLHSSAHLTLFFGTLKNTDGIEQTLHHITRTLYLEKQPAGKGILLLIEKEKAAAAKQALDERGFAAIDTEHIIALDKPLEAHLTLLESNIDAIRKESIVVQNQLHAFAAEHDAFLVSAEIFLATEAKKAQAPLRFGVTKNSFLVHGWVPSSTVNALKKDLETHLHNQIHFEHHAAHHDDAPVKLNNSFAVAPFEALLNLYTLPKYHEIDPSTFLFLSFPIFFGFMLGDIGYGITLLILFLIMRATAKGPMMKSMASILIMSAVSTVIFGIVFGEFFGAEHIGSFELHPLIHRTHDMTTLLGVAVAVGVIHITIGLLIGFVNEYHHHGLWKAFCAKISWLILLSAAGLLAAGYVFHLPTIIAGYALGIASIALIYLGEGVKGLIELPAIFSNIMSYARLMALGVASAALAVVVNEMAGGLFAAGGIVNIALAVFILLVGHAINLLLGIIGPFLHSLRLHYVEFFSKFYEGGGKPYKPFGVDEQL